VNCPRSSPETNGQLSAGPFPISSFLLPPSSFPHASPPAKRQPRIGPRQHQLNDQLTDDIPSEAPDLPAAMPGKTEVGLEEWLAKTWNRKKITTNSPRRPWAGSHMGNLE
jgi:hypothetical protein